MIMRRVDLMVALMLASGLLWVMAPDVARAQEQPQPEEQGEAPAPDEAQPQPPEDDEDASDPLGNLDDLLDIPDEDRDSQNGDEDVLRDLDSDRQELERRLTAQEMSDQFQQAITQMGEAAERMARAGDVGIQTQRLQEEVLTKLDILIEESKKGGKGKSKGDPKNNDNPSDAPAQPQAGGQDSQEAGQGENTTENMPPAFESAELQRRLDLSKAEWGQLPERLRELLIQGMEGKHSALYEKLTEEFYKNLAKEQDE